jgi:hypothetical protein
MTADRPPASGEPSTDWTRDEAGRSNGGELFESLADEVARLIRSSSHSLLNGDSEGVGRLIMAQLAHKHGLSPAEARATPPALDVERLGLSDEQTRNLRQHLISRQQTLGEWISDVLFDFRMGRPDGIDYPPPSRLSASGESPEPSGEPGDE